VISCGSYTLDASGNADISLGYEPQWVLLKKTNGAAGWVMMDTMRGFSLGGDEGLLANSANAAFTYGANTAFPTATGFSLRGWGASGSQEIYIAIRRGPMKVPTTGTSVFTPVATSASAGTKTTTNFPIDLQFAAFRPGDQGNTAVNDRLRGVSSTSTTSTITLLTSGTGAESGQIDPSLATKAPSQGWDNTGFQIPAYLGGASSIYWNFRRAPGFFDEVCYTGTGVARTVAHNLTVAPELMIVKSRSSGFGWHVYALPLGIGNYLILNQNIAATADPGNVLWNNSAPTSTVFSVGTNASVNQSSGTYVAYLFASCPGVSKVGSYTGNGGQQGINCGFAGGARFVIIKRTDSTGDWYVWDTARGMVSGTNPYLLLNSAAAEVNPSTSCRTNSNGFTVNQTSGTNINVSSATYIFLAIA
jgi:hypothetical protein